MTENGDQNRIQVKRWIAIGLVLGLLSLIAIGTLAVLDSPYHIGEGIEIDNEGGPTIKIGESVSPESADQSPGENTIDLWPYAVFESDGHTYAKASGWESDWLVLEELDVADNSLTVTRHGKDIDLSGEATMVEINDYEIGDKAVDIETDGDTSVTLDAPDNFDNQYLVLLDAETDERVAVSSTDEISTTISEDRTLVIDSQEVTFEDAQPQDNVLLEQSTDIQLEVDVNHPRFADGDVDVNFYDDGGDLIATDTLSEAGTASVTWDYPQLGENDWYAETDYDGETHQSDSYKFRVPHELEIRDEQTAELLDDLETDITVRFFAIDEEEQEVFSRTTDDGIVDLAGLPTDVDLVVDTDADGYISRSTIIRDISQQQTAFLLDEDEEVNAVSFQLEDRTDSFPSETSRVLIRKPIEFDDGTSYQTIVGDTFGANERVEADLESNERYRIVVENEDGDERSLGSYVADQPGDIVRLDIGEISITPPDADDYVFDAREIDYELDDGIQEAVRLVYRDGSESTNYVEVEIYERGNESNILHGPETYQADRFADLIDIPTEKQNISAWTVEYRIDRDVDDELIEGKTYTGGLIDEDWPLSSTLLQVLGIGSLLLVAGLFGGTLSRVGGVVVVIMAWTMQAIGILSVPLEFLVAAGVVALFFIIGSRRPTEVHA